MVEESDSRIHQDTIDMETDSASTNSTQMGEESDSMMSPWNETKVEETILSKALQGISFSCSGSLRIDPEWEKKQGTFDFLLESPSLPPVTIRWDDEGRIGKIQLPLQGHDTSKLDQLIKHGGPATFGHLGIDVLDESYRKATKLDSSQFSSNFHPHDHGILDAISQTLLPTVTGLNSPDQTYHSENWGLVAELYKLNIYSAPSGRFKAHVDTPRGPRQWGSLVVCLPVSHFGGQLRIAHRGEEIVHDWGNADPSTIEWVAFYSDCEHEVFEVTKGHRITLTYNLYISEQLGGVLRPFSSADPTRYPIYEKAKAQFEDAVFLKEGGTLGFYCAHHYAHTMKAQSKRLPYALKGSDAIFYSVFRHLGCAIDLRPVIAYNYDTEAEEEANLRQWPNFPEPEDEYESEDTDMEGANPPARVGIGLPKLKVTKAMSGDGRTTKSMFKEWAKYENLDIEWLNKPSNPETAFVHLAYGNEASLEWYYSSLAIVVDIPPSHERISTKEASNKDQNVGKESKDSDQS